MAQDEQKGRLEGEIIDRTYSATLDGCVLTWKQSLEPYVHGTVTVIDLSESDIIVVPHLSSSEQFPVDRLTVRTSGEIMQKLSPALWAYMGGENDQLPSETEILDQYAYYDPWGASVWWDPSMMTYREQLQINASWNAAVEADTTGLLSKHFDVWLAPQRLLWRPELKTPGANVGLLLHEGSADAAADMIKNFVAGNCEG